MSATPLSTFIIPITLHELLRTLDNLELRNLERRGTARLAFIIVGPAGLVGDIDAGHVGDAARNDTVCTGHSWR